MQISMGTAQIGMNYGITSKNKSISKKDLLKIFLFIKQKNIKELDISPLYGNLLQRIKKFKLKRFKITYKAYLSKDKFFEKKLYQQILFDLKILNLKKFDKILIHNPHQVNSSKLFKSLKVLKTLKKEGVVKKIGISIYDKKDFEKILNKIKIDVIQVPLNILDQRLIQKNWLKKICKKNIEIQVRSVFLQGILLSNIKNFKNDFLEKNVILKKWFEYCLNNRQLKLDHSLNFLKNERYIKSIIVGFENINQFKEIYLSIIKKRKENNYTKFFSNSIFLIDPRKWNKSKIFKKNK